MLINQSGNGKMTKKDDDFLTPAAKKIRFRGDLNLYHFENNHIEDIFDDPERRKLKNFGDSHAADEANKKGTHNHSSMFTSHCCCWFLSCMRLLSI